VLPIAIERRKTSELGLVCRKVLIPGAFFSLLHVQAAFLRLIEELMDEFIL